MDDRTATIVEELRRQNKFLQSVRTPQRDENQLLRDWKKQKFSWDEYEKCYHEEMQQQRQTIKELAKTAKPSTYFAAKCEITLLCFEREGNPSCSGSRLLATA